MLLDRFCSDSTKIGAPICHVKVKNNKCSDYLHRTNEAVQRSRIHLLQEGSAEALNTTGTDE